MIHGLMKYPVAESTGRATEGIDSIIARNQEDVLQEQYKLHGTIGPDPNYDEEGNIIPIMGYPPDIALSPFFTPKGLLGLLKEARKTGDVTKLFRGAEEWYPGSMVKKGKFLGKDPLTKQQVSNINEAISTFSKNKSYLNPYYKNVLSETFENLPVKKGTHGAWATSKFDRALGYSNPWKEKGLKNVVLEFDVPNDYLRRKTIQTGFDTGGQMGDTYLFMKGLPKQFLQKMRKQY